MSFRNMFHHKKKLITSSAFLIVALLIILVFQPFAPSLERQSEGIVLVECRSFYSLPISKGDTLYLKPKFEGYALKTIALCPEEIATRSYSSGVIISKKGYVVTSASIAEHEQDNTIRKNTRAVLEQANRQLDTIFSCIKEQIEELNYYANTHSPTDDGYQRVMEFRQETINTQKNVKALRQKIKKALKEKNFNATPNHLFRIRHNRIADSTRIASTSENAECVARQDSNLILLQLEGGKTFPQSHNFKTFLWSPDHWPLFGKSRYLLAFQYYVLPTEKLPTALPDVIDIRERKYPHFNLAEGGAVVTRTGLLTGIMAHGGIVSANHINKMLKSARNIGSTSLSSPQSAETKTANTTNTPKEQKSEPAKANTQIQKTKIPVRNFIKKSKAGKLYHNVPQCKGYEGRTIGNKRSGQGKQVYANGSLYTGEWSGDKRSGYGVFIDSNGVRYEGIWRADTLVKGSVFSRDEFYCGEFDKRLRRNGSGWVRMHSGGYYEGDWKEGKREGFGFSIEPRHIVRCGIWNQNKFRGEQMVYTQRRVYGIDISRYQHEVGRKRYAIHWNKLRITGIGSVKNRRIHGEIDYPVSFVYIKASEGTSIRNRYYAADIRAARRHGIAAGAYHFFTTKPGKAQALYFLKTAKPRKGDLPPVLDMELSDKQIKKMGGNDVLFRNIIQWCDIVKKRCGVTPILYLSQRFVNKYLPYFPYDKKKLYKVWIARYGEYKPYVHLLYWQLSPYGSVNGIHGYVDINVFNGTHELFKEMVRTDCVP